MKKINLNILSQKQNNRLHSSAGFSLGEIMIVLVIIGGIMAIVLPKIQDGQRKSEVNQTKMKMIEITTKINEYYAECGKYPSSVSFITDDDTSCKNWAGNPKLKHLLKDAWGSDLQYSISGNGYNLKSLGRDRKEGGTSFDKDLFLTNLLVEKNNHGFSLLEIVVVILIIGGILSIAVPKMSFNKTDTKKVIREITQTVKEVRNRAKLYGTTYRLAFRMEEGNQAYWVEKSTTVTFIDKAALEKARNDSKDTFRKEDENAPSSPFQPDTTFFKKEQKLPKNYSFKLVESGSQNVSYSDGLAYIHFFPQGFIETALVQIEDPKKNIWSVTFNPITGIATILTEAKTLKELNPL